MPRSASASTRACRGRAASIPRRSSWRPAFTAFTSSSARSFSPSACGARRKVISSPSITSGSRPRPGIGILSTSCGCSSSSASTGGAWAAPSRPSTAGEHGRYPALPTRFRYARGVCVPLPALRRGAAFLRSVDGSPELPGLRPRLVGAERRRRPGGVRHLVSRADRCRPDRDRRDQVLTAGLAASPVMDAADPRRRDPDVAAAESRAHRPAVQAQSAASAPACMIRRLAPTLFTIPVVLICVGLGVWQLERLHWKRGLIAQREAAVAAAPASPPQSLVEARALEFHPILADGVFLNDKEIYLNAIGPHGGAGFHVLTPLREASGRIAFVNRGFVPTDHRN